MRKIIPPRECITPEMPLRLDIAAAMGYPDGSMTASGLRREAQRGRLVIERVAGKDYTTLAYIEQMRALCRVEIKDLDFGSDRHAETTKEPTKRFGRSSTGANMSPRDALKAKLNVPSSS
jgi:hypothetical protein